MSLTGLTEQPRPPIARPSIVLPIAAISAGNVGGRPVAEAARTPLAPKRLAEIAAARPPRQARQVTVTQITYRRVTFSEIVNPTPHVVGDLEARSGHPGEPLRPRPPPPIEVIELSSDEELQEDSS